MIPRVHRTVYVRFIYYIDMRDLVLVFATKQARSTDDIVLSQTL